MARITDIDDTVKETIMKIFKHYILKQPDKVFLEKGDDWQYPIIRLKLKTGVYESNKYNIIFRPNLDNQGFKTQREVSIRPNWIQFESDEILMELIRGTSEKLSGMVMTEYGSIRDVKLSELLDDDK